MIGVFTFSKSKIGYTTTKKVDKHQSQDVSRPVHIRHWRSTYGKCCYKSKSCACNCAWNPCCCWKFWWSSLT